MSNITIFFIVLAGLVVLGGWATAEYNYRITSKRNAQYKERALKLERQAESLHRLLNDEKQKSARLEEDNEETAEFKNRYENLEIEYKKLVKEAKLLESTLLSIRKRTTSKEYMGNALGKVIAANIDKIFPTDKEKSEQIAEGARQVFKRIRGNIDN